MQIQQGLYRRSHTTCSTRHVLFLWRKSEFQMRQVRIWTLLYESMPDQRLEQQSQSDLQDLQRRQWYMLFQNGIEQLVFWNGFEYKRNESYSYIIDICRFDL